MVKPAVNTDRELAGLKPEPARYERAVTKARGLSVLVYPNGCKSFVVRYRAMNGRRRRLLLGDYPGLGLADARLKAQGLRIDVVAGKDPAGERATARARARLGRTLGELAEGYWSAARLGLHGGRRRPLRAETIERQQGLWRRHIEPTFGRRTYEDLKRADIRQFMEGLVRQGRLSPSSIASVGDVLRALFAYALHNDLVEANPTLGLTRPIIPQSRTRLFSEEGLRAIVRALLDASCSAGGREDPYARMGPHMALCLRFLILTFTRRSEAAGARWSELDLATAVWTIPGSRTKNRQVHVVPLSTQALAVLAAARELRVVGGCDDDYVFPSPSKPGAHVETHAMTRAVKRLCERFDLPAGSPHDFRRTGATLMTSERFGFRRFMVGKVLGHTSNDGAAVTAIYDRNDYLPEKRQVLSAWGLYIESLEVAPGETPVRRRHLTLVAS